MKNATEANNAKTTDWLANPDMASNPQYAENPVGPNDLVQVITEDLDEMDINTDIGSETSNHFLLLPLLASRPHVIDARDECEPGHWILKPETPEECESASACKSYAHTSSCAWIAASNSASHTENQRRRPSQTRM